MAKGSTEVLWRPDPARHLSVLFDVFALGQRVRTLVTSAMADCGLRPDEYAAYSVVFEAGSVTMTELARELGMPVTTAADFVRAMRQRSHARRTRHPTDNRAYQLSLTPAGLRAHRKASAAFEQAHEAFVRALSPSTEESARISLRNLIDAAGVASDSMRSGHSAARASNR